MSQSIEKLESRIDKLEVAIMLMAGANMKRLTKKEFKSLMLMLNEMRKESWYKKDKRLEEIIKEE